MTTEAPAPVDRLTLSIALQVGMLAPSIHNTQPWRFELGDGLIDVFADRSRWLPATDPSARELHISCGAAIRYVRLGLTKQGVHSSVRLMPNPHDAHHLARIYAEGPARPTEHELRTIEGVFLRYTDRGRYANKPVPTELVDALQEGVREYGSKLHPLVSQDELLSTAELLKRADEIVSASASYRMELKRWVRNSNAAEDGIIPSALASKVTTSSTDPLFTQRDFSLGTLDPQPEQALYGVLWTKGDSVYDWLMAGQALGWLLARAAQEGVTGQPLSQIIEVPSVRQRLRVALPLNGGYPQMLLRLGYGEGGPKTRRRSVNDAIRKVAHPAELGEQ